MRPTDFCTPKPFKLEHPWLRRFPALRPFVPVAYLSVPSRGSRTRTEPCGSCSFTRNVFFRAPATLVRGRAEQASGSSGPTDANEAGENRGSQRDPHFDGRASAARGRCLPSCAIAVTVSDTPVASFVLLGVKVAVAISTLWLEGRQGRFRGGSVKSVRFPDPRCLPSPEISRNPAAPKCVRTRGTSFDRSALT